MVGRYSRKDVLCVTEYGVGFLGTPAVRPWKGVDAIALSLPLPQGSVRGVWSPVFCGEGEMGPVVLWTYKFLCFSGRLF